MAGDIDRIRSQLAGTNIDPRSLLSTDYFNHFNEVIMMLNMLPDAPEMLDDIDKWTYKTYREHFMGSELGFAPLAIEAYEHSPAGTRERLEKITLEMGMLITESRARLRKMLEEGSREQFNDMALFYSMQLQGMVDDGGAVIHGSGASADQSAIDKMF